MVEEEEEEVEGEAVTIKRDVVEIEGAVVETTRTALLLSSTGEPRINEKQLRARLIITVDTTQGNWKFY